MKKFQKTVLSTALILLIVILTAFAILLRTSRAELIYPPMLTVCPDQYKIDGSKCVFNNNNGAGLTSCASGLDTNSGNGDTTCCVQEFLISDYKSISHSLSYL